MIQTLYQLRHWFGWAVIGLIAAVVAYWGFVYTTQTKTIRLATAAEGGWYYEFGTILKRHIEQQTPYRVQLLVTSGSVDNRRRLLAGEADMAIVQVAAVSMQNLASIAPLWDDYIHVIVRRGSGIETLWDLPGRNVAIGVPGSGYRANALQVLNYYGIDPESLGNNAAYFGDLLTDPTLDAAIVTTGLVNPDLRAVIASGKFELLPLPGTAGFAFNNRFYRATEIPLGVYPAADSPPKPTQPTPTVTTDAILVGRHDLPAHMVEAVLPVINSVAMLAETAALVQRDPREDAIWRLLPMHEASVNYYTPYSGFGMLADFLSELAKFKELLLVFLLLIPAAVYQWKQHKRLRQENQLRAMRRQLEEHFNDIFRIERAQREAKDIRLLQDHLNQTNYIKMKATKLCLGTPVGESNLFLAFLQQTNSVIREIEWRLSLAATRPAAERMEEA